MGTAQSSLGHGECTVCDKAAEGGAGMCLDDYDFPLPAEGGDAVEDVQRKRHMTEERRDKGERQ